MIDFSDINLNLYDIEFTESEDGMINVPYFIYNFIYSEEEVSVLSDMLNIGGYNFISKRFCEDIMAWDLRDAISWNMCDILTTQFEDLPLLVGEHRTKFEKIVLSWRFKIGK